MTSASEGGLRKSDECRQGGAGGQKTRKFCRHHLSMAPCFVSRPASFAAFVLRHFICFLPQTKGEMQCFPVLNIKICLSMEGINLCLNFLDSWNGRMKKSWHGSGYSKGRFFKHLEIANLLNICFWSRIGTGLHFRRTAWNYISPHFNLPSFHESFHTERAMLHHNNFL